MYKITFLRHAESAGNHEGVVQGQSDRPLTAQGEAQAQALASYWAANPPQFEYILSSPLQRALQTANTVGAALGLTPESDAIWMERSFGQLEGQPYGSAEQMDPPVDFYHPYTRVGTHGESVLDLYLRAGTALQNLLHRPPGNYLVVSHGALLNMLFFMIIGITPQGHYNSPRFIFYNTGFSETTYDEEKRQWRVWSLNNLPHWPARP